MDAITAIRTRRTIKTFTGAEIPRPQIEELVELACCAPNHRMTQPWRFYALDRPGIARLVARFHEPDLAGVVDPRKLSAVAERLAQCGAVIQMTCLAAGGDEQQREDRDAVCAAAQNLLLAAHATGLGSFWSTNPLFAQPTVMRWLGADPANERFLGAVWLGHPTQQPPTPPRRPVAEVLRWA